MGCARNPSHFIFIGFLMSYQFQLLVCSSNVFERLFLLRDCVYCRTYSQSCFTCPALTLRLFKSIILKLPWLVLQLVSLCLGSAIQINKESNISKSRSETFASQKCCFFPTICHPYFPLLPPCSFLSFPFCILCLALQLWPHVHPYTATTSKGLSFFLSRSRKECAFTLAGAVFGREGGRDIAISEGKTQIFKQYSKEI